MDVRRLGVHTSISGGIHRSLERANDLGCSAVQIFSHNPRGWSVKPLNPLFVKEFHTLRERMDLHAVIHASYLINLATPSPVLLERSIALMKLEMDRADLLGVPHVVVHPGRASGEPAERGIQRAGDALLLLAELGPWKARILLENTAGSRGDITAFMKNLGSLMHNAEAFFVGGVCLDTCHAHAAGYDLSRKDGYDRWVGEIQECIGLENVRLIHLNDSRGEAGSGVDRHAHIGEGTIGKAGLARAVNHEGFRSAPMILETPQNTEEDDHRNLRCAREFLR